MSGKSLSASDRRIQSHAEGIVEKLSTGTSVDSIVEDYGLIVRECDRLNTDDAAVIGRIIFVRDRMPSIKRQLCILHELGHVLLHGLCIGYRMQDETFVKKQEREAETFAMLCLFPTVNDYDTEDDFIRRCGLSEATALLRLKYYRRTGQ